MNEQTVGYSGRSLAQKLGIGRLPGDFRFRIGKREFLLPFASTLLLTVLMFLIARLV